MKRLFSLSLLLLILISSCKKDATQSTRVDASDNEEVKFVYNGDTVKYGTIISPTTGRKWMDRNLGAKRKAKSSTDALGFGDYFQWGRLIDGHQNANSDTTSVRSTTDVPGHSKFILGTYDASVNGFPSWENPWNPNLWQGSHGINNPCPKGWHVPTKDEWTAEAPAITDYGSAYSVLKLTESGYRSDGDGSLVSPGESIYYWTSTPDLNSNPNSPGSYYYRVVAPPRLPTAVFACPAGMNVRCIK